VSKVSKKEVWNDVADVLMNCVVGSVEDGYGTVRLLKYEKLKDGEVVEMWRKLVCEVRPELRITD